MRTSREVSLTPGARLARLCQWKPLVVPAWKPVASRPETVEVDDVVQSFWLLVSSEGRRANIIAGFCTPFEQCVER